MAYKEISYQILLRPSFKFWSAVIKAFIIVLSIKTNHNYNISVITPFKEQYGLESIDHRGRSLSHRCECRKNSSI